MEKKIHYIWLGGKKKPRVVRKCISSWKKHMPDWEIKEWNETNLDLDINPFCRQAYDAKKYAFAADVLRFDILYKEGGLYFDTDVKAIKDFTPLAKKNICFSGYEISGKINPGLVLYCPNKHESILSEVLDIYNNSSFVNEDGSYNLRVVGDYLFDVLRNKNKKRIDDIDYYEDFVVYPAAYFAPRDDIHRTNLICGKTYSIHLYAATWTPVKRKIIIFFKRLIYDLLGANCVDKIMGR